MIGGQILKNFAEWNPDFRVGFPTEAGAETCGESGHKVVEWNLHGAGSELRLDETQRERNAHVFVRTLGTAGDAAREQSKNRAEAQRNRLLVAVRFLRRCGRDLLRFRMFV